MLSGDMARYQIADRVRDAQADRIARTTRRARAAGERGSARRVGRVAVAAALWPFKR